MFVRSRDMSQCAQGGRRGVYAVVIGSPVIKLFDWQDQITGQKVFNIQLNQVTH